jgi:hypothetical protein
MGSMEKANVGGFARATRKKDDDDKDDWGITLNTYKPGAESCSPFDFGATNYPNHCST